MHRLRAIQANFASAIGKLAGNPQSPRYDRALGKTRTNFPYMPHLVRESILRPVPEIHCAGFTSPSHCLTEFSKLF